MHLVCAKTIIHKNDFYQFFTWSETLGGMQSCSRIEAVSRPNRMMGKADEGWGRTRQTHSAYRRDMGSSISGQIRRITSGKSRWHQGLVATCKDYSNEVNSRRRGEPDEDWRMSL